MHIQKISVDNWKGVSSNDFEYPCKTTDDATEAVRQLNGKNRTMVTLTANNTTLTVAGGNEDRYVCYLTIGVDDAFMNLINPKVKVQDTVEIVAGGQKGIFSARQCIDLEMVLQAVKYFTRYGKSNPELHWE